MTTITELKKQIERLENLRETDRVGLTEYGHGELKILKEWLKEKEELERIIDEWYLKNRKAGTGVGLHYEELKAKLFGEEKKSK